MSFSGNSLAAGQVAAAQATIYTSSAKSILKQLDFFNVAVTQETLSVWFKRSGGTARQIGRAVLQQNESAKVLSEGETIVMSAGDTIEADATNASAVDFTITGATE